MKILVTGASGFIGRVLCAKLMEVGHDVLACSRSCHDDIKSVYIPYPPAVVDTDWLPALSGIGAVVHLAGLARIDAAEGTPEIEAEYQLANVEASRCLAAASKRAGVQHFIFMSSLHAVAASSDEAITAETPCIPSSAYGRSKLDTERIIKRELEGSSCAWTFVRPPLVYGRGNNANFGMLLKLVKTGLPLPLASVRNRRSFVYVENLVDLIATCLGNPKAFGKTLLPSDGEDVSTPELIRAIARANESVQCCLGAVSPSLGSVSSDLVPNKPRRNPLPATRHSIRLFPFPESALKVMGRLPGFGALRKLTSSLHVDSEPIRRDLGWTPPFTMEEGLRRMLAKRN